SARCRIDAAVTAHTDRPLDYGAQFAGGFDRTTAARVDDRARYPPCGVVLAVGVNYMRESFFALFVDNIVGTEWLALIHPHIERALSPETEAARRIVQRKT